MIDDPKEVWLILLSYKFKNDKFNNEYNIYWRSTKYTPQSQWYKVEFRWAVERDYGEHPVQNIECCIRIPRPAPPWFIKNDFFGFDSLVLERKN